MKPLYNIIDSFLLIFKTVCPSCGSTNNKVECYKGNPYAKNPDWKTGRQCSDCVEFWYDK